MYIRQNMNSLSFSKTFFILSLQEKSFDSKATCLSIVDAGTVVHSWKVSLFHRGKESSFDDILTSLKVEALTSAKRIRGLDSS